VRGVGNCDADPVAGDLNRQADARGCGWSEPDAVGDEFAGQQPSSFQRVAGDVARNEGEGISASVWRLIGRSKGLAQFALRPAGGPGSQAFLLQSVEHTAQLICLRRSNRRGRDCILDE
jgi:hypothetical protein